MAVLGAADLRGAFFKGADLRGAVLGDADLRQAVLPGAVWTDGRVCGGGSVGSCK